jgi:hypothetical protein
MRASRAAVSLVTFLASAAMAQQPSVNPGSTVPSIGRLEQTPPSRARPVPLTPVETAVIARRLNDYRTRLLSDAPRADDLIRAGLAEPMDAVEQARATQPGKLPPIHVGVLARLPAPPAAQVDPALQTGARMTLHARLGREPSAAELQAEIAQFDARIARMNDALAARRTEITRAMRSTGQFPRALERRILGVPAAAEPADPEQVETGFQMLVRALLLDQSGTPQSGFGTRPPAVSTPLQPAPGGPRDAR